MQAYIVAGPKQLPSLQVREVEEAALAASEHKISITANTYNNLLIGQLFY